MTLKIAATTEWPSTTKFARTIGYREDGGKFFLRIVTSFKLNLETLLHETAMYNQIEDVHSCWVTVWFLLALPQECRACFLRCLDGSSVLVRFPALT